VVVENGGRMPSINELVATWALPVGGAVVLLGLIYELRRRRRRER